MCNLNLYGCGECKKCTEITSDKINPIEKRIEIRKLKYIECENNLNKSTIWFISHYFRKLLKKIFG